MPSVSMDIGDAAELVELLQFVHDWLATEADHIDGSLRADLNRFVFLLGGGDGEVLFGHESE